MIIISYKCKCCILPINIVKSSDRRRFVVFAFSSIVKIFVRFMERGASNFGSWQNYERDERQLRLEVAEEVCSGFLTHGGRVSAHNPVRWQLIISHLPILTLSCFASAPSQPLFPRTRAFHSSLILILFLYAQPRLLHTAELHVN